MKYQPLKKWSKQIQQCYVTGWEGTGCKTNRQINLDIFIFWTALNKVWKREAIMIKGMRLPSSQRTVSLYMQQDANP
jgi:hypothetical protein